MSVIAAIAAMQTAGGMDWLGTPLAEDPVYLDRKEKGLVKFRGRVQYTESRVPRHRC